VDRGRTVSRKTQQKNTFAPNSGQGHMCAFFSFTVPQIRSLPGWERRESQKLVGWVISQAFLLLPYVSDPRCPLVRIPSPWVTILKELFPSSAFAGGAFPRSLSSVVMVLLLLALADLSLISVRSTPADFLRELKQNSYLGFLELFFFPIFFS